MQGLSRYCFAVDTSKIEFFDFFHCTLLQPKYQHFGLKIGEKSMKFDFLENASEVVLDTAEGSWNAPRIQIKLPDSLMGTVDAPATFEFCLENRLFWGNLWISHNLEANSVHPTSDGSLTFYAANSVSRPNQVPGSHQLHLIPRLSAGIVEILYCGWFLENWIFRFFHCALL